MYNLDMSNILTISRIVLHLAGNSNFGNKTPRPFSKGFNTQDVSRILIIGEGITPPPIISFSVSLIELYLGC
jgi:hypothetical protein